MVLYQFNSLTNTNKMQLNSNLTPTCSQIQTKLPKVENLDMAYELAVFMKNNKAHLEAQKQKARINETSKELGSKKNIFEEAYGEQISVFEAKPMCVVPEFRLILAKIPTMPLCKGKYFGLKVCLQPLTQFSYPMNEKIELEVLVFSEDDNLITKNMKGKDILRGNFIQSMNFFSLEQGHVAYFRIQLTEVSSHYVGKNLKIKIQARKSNFLRATGWKVKSTFISNVVVKAKHIATSTNS